MRGACCSTIQHDANERGQGSSAHARCACCRHASLRAAATITTTSHHHTDGQVMRSLKRPSQGHATASCCVHIAAQCLCMDSSLCRHAVASHLPGTFPDIWQTIKAQRSWRPQEWTRSVHSQTYSSLHVDEATVLTQYSGRQPCTHGSAACTHSSPAASNCQLQQTHTCGFPCFSG